MGALTGGPRFRSPGISSELVCGNPWKDYAFLFPQWTVTLVNGCWYLLGKVWRKLGGIHLWLCVGPQQS